MLKFNKPKFWDKKKVSFFSLILFPFTLLTLLVIFFKKSFTTTKKYNIPIICVGNIYIGGTGKTPTSILIAKELLNYGVPSVILRKYYKDQEDEYKQIKNNFSNLIINKKRDAGIKDAISKGHKLVILDDGLQDYKIYKNLNIVCFNSGQLIGNGLVLPSGPLRENLNALKNTNIVIINGEKNISFEEKILKINNNLDIYYSYYKPLNIDQFKDHKLLALAGIGNPENFFDLLDKNGLIVKKKLIYPDHHEFNKDEIRDIINISKNEKLKIIMTEKDFFKLNNFKFEGFDYLKVSLEIYNKDKFIKKIKKYV